MDFEIRPHAGQNLAIDIYITDFKSIKPPQDSYPQNISPNPSQTNSNPTPKRENQTIDTPKQNPKPISQKDKDINDIKYNGVAFIIALFVGFIVIPFIVNLLCNIFNLNKSIIFSETTLSLYLPSLILFSESLSLSIDETARSIELEKYINRYVLIGSSSGFALLIIGLITKINRPIYSTEPIGIIVFILAFYFIVLLYLHYKVYIKIAYITNQPLFMWAFGYLLQ